MSVPFTRRPRSVLSGGSLLTVLALAGTGGAVSVPTTALAANECTPGNATTLSDPGGNAATADTYICNGSYSSVTYTTNGVFTLRLQNNATATTGGVTVVGATGNNITINRLNDDPPHSGDPFLTNTAGAALWVTNGGAGAIAVNLTDPGPDNIDEPMRISGTTAGVLLQKTGGGAGNVTFTTTNGSISASAGSAIDLSTDGTGNVTINSRSTVTASNYGVRAGATTGNVTVSNGGQLAGDSGAILVTGGNDAIIDNGSINWRARLDGTVTLNNTGAVTFTNTNAAWNWTGTSSLGSGDTALTNSADAFIRTRGASILDFSTGTDSLTNEGMLVAGAGTQGAATLTLLGLETWNNSGTVIFGEGALSGLSDGVANDRIVSSGTLFTGSGDSLLMMDVGLSVDQADCAAAVTADCFDLRNSSTAGVTGVLVNVVDASLTGAERVVLVDVAGSGTSGAGHFVLSDESTGYRQLGAAGAVESGLFLYTLDYDAAAQQHVLRPSAFGGKTLELARISRAASEPWRTVTGLWHDRQVDLRGAASTKQAGPAAWIKLVSSDVSQKGLDGISIGADRLSYNLGARQNTRALVGGVDLMRRHNGDQALVLGLTAGQLDSTVDYLVGTSRLELEGYSVGAYATLVKGSLFVDAIVNGTHLDLTHQDMGQRFAGAAKSMGVQLESGYRLLQLNEGGAFIEPLVAVSYVRTRVDDLTLGSVSARFEDGDSLRAGLGLRMAGDLEMEALTARLGFTGRIWRELDGEQSTTLRASFGETRLVDQQVDTLSDIGVSLGLFRPGAKLSADIAYSLKFAEDYKSNDASLSVRYAF